MVLLIVGLTVGCHRNAVQHKDPPDPLLITKKPVEGRPRPADTTAAAWNEPPPPMRDPSPLAPQDEPGRSRPSLAGGQGSSWDHPR
jgi:hypothetical protein